MTKTYLKQDVFEAALDRIRFLYDEFPQVFVSFSGGKDSTVIFNLAARVAEEKGRLPVNVLWLDQEAEWEHVVDYVRSVMHDPRVRPYWFQGPFLLTNATTTGEDPWLHCWEEGGQWIRPKEPDSIHENKTGCVRFHELFGAISKTYFGGAPCADIGGVRCEESPGRLAGITGRNIYKGRTWGKVRDRAAGHYDFYPLYDWSWTDVWKAIHDNGWRYCELYNFMYQYGLPVHQMRVSNVHHETAIHVLRFLQEIEPETWDKIVDRVSGVNAVSKCYEAYRVPAELPRAFASWREYRDYLLENLILADSARAAFARNFALWDGRYPIDEPPMEEALMRHCVKALLVNDYEGNTHGQFQVAVDLKGLRKRCQRNLRKQRRDVAPPSGK